MKKSLLLLAVAALSYNAWAGELVTLPEGLVAKSYQLGSLVTSHPAQVQVAVDGADFYVQGLCELLPEAWLKGSIENKGQFEHITLPYDQYVGAVEVEGVKTDVYFNGADEDRVLSDLEIVYSPAKDSFDAYYQYLFFTNEQGSTTYCYLKDIFFLNGTKELVEVPAGLEAKLYRMEGKFMDMDKPTSYYVNVGIDGDDVYVQGISEAMPEAWICGHINRNGYVIFEQNQYMGEYATSGNTYDIWLKGVDSFEGLYDDVALAYDAATGVFTQQQNMWLSVNASLTEFEWLTLLGDMVLSPVEEEIDLYALVTPPADLETSTYTVSAMDYSFGADWAEALPEYEVEVGRNGSDIYVKGLFLDIEDAWVKGTLEDNVVTFNYPQYLGLWWGMMDTWMMGVNAADEAVPVTMTYDPVANRFEQNDDTMIYFNDDPLVVSVMPLQIIAQVALQGEANPVAIDAVEAKRKQTASFNLFGQRKADRSGISIQGGRIELRK